MSRGILGWSLGPYSICVARVPSEGAEPDRLVRRPGRLPGDAATLAALLTECGREAGAGPGAEHALTLAGDLVMLGRTRRVAVNVVLDAYESTFPRAALHLLGSDGRFLTAEAARAEPFAVSGTRWLAAGDLVAEGYPDAVLIDVGAGVTELVPIVGGDIVAVGRTDPERVLEGELIGAGAVTTPVEALAHTVPLWEDEARVAGGVACMGDVHLWRGALRAEEHAAAGVAATREDAGDRLARTVCGDREMLDELTVGRIAAAFATAQTTAIVRALERVRSRHPSIRTAVVTGAGAFIAAEAARTAGLQVERLADGVGTAAASAAPALAVARMFAAQLTD